MNCTELNEYPYPVQTKAKKYHRGLLRATYPTNIAIKSKNSVVKKSPLIAPAGPVIVRFQILIDAYQIWHLDGN